ncbi:hypothetical protein QFC24_004514 [Naganishia onofrii]|uniref:Uncharacterized protein n=1 Tax=Naganishia onofrii TaxID=1851511 RepID=A0ACC2XF95_9TREE|nr:hypothetical protein QFC24_004514 [Naganishia onofrii]
MDPPKPPADESDSLVAIDQGDLKSLMEGICAGMKAKANMVGEESSSVDPKSLRDIYFFPDEQKLSDRDLVDRNATATVLKESLLATIGEPLNDVPGLSTRPNPLLETHQSRWLRAGSLYLLNHSDTAKDMAAIAKTAANPGKNFLAAVQTTHRMAQAIEKDQAEGATDKTLDASKERKRQIKSADLRRKGEQEGLTGVAKRTYRKIKVDNLSEKAQKILNKPTDIIVPQSAFGADVYRFRLCDGNNAIKILKKKPSDHKYKSKSEEKAWSTMITMPQEDDWRGLGDVAFRCATYLLEKEGYTWDSKEWKAVVKHIVTHEGRPKDLIVPNIPVPEMDFTSLIGETKSTLMRTSDIAGYLWKTGYQPPDETTEERFRIVLQQRTSTNRQRAGKSLPASLSKEDRAELAKQIKCVVAHLVNKKGFKPEKATIDKAWNFIVLNASGEFPGWEEKLPLVDIQVRYLCDLRAPKKREYGVDLLVDPAEFAPESITNVRFMVHVDGNRFFFNIDEFQGAEVPEDLQQLPEAWSVRFEEKYLQRLSGLRSNQSLEGMTRANHELMQEWIRRFVVQVRKANHSVAIVQDLCDYANSVFFDTGSIWAAIDCVAFKADLYVAENFERGDTKPMVCVHPQQDQSESCPSCKATVECSQLILIDNDTYCEKCLTPPEVELSDEASPRAARYAGEFPTLTRLLKIAWHKAVLEKQLAEEVGSGPVHVSDLSKILVDVLGKLNKEHICDFAAPAAELDLDDENRLTQSTLLSKYRVVVCADGQGNPRVGIMTEGNVAFSSLGAVLLKYTHSLPTLRCLILSIANRRGLDDDALEESLSCLVERDSKGRPLLNNVPAKSSEAGRMMRALWCELDACAQQEIQVPHPRKHRVNKNKLPLSKLASIMKHLQEADERVQTYDSAAKAMAGVKGANLPRIDENLSRSCASFDTSTSAKDKRFKEPVDDDTRDLVKRIVDEITQSLSKGEKLYGLPQGKDGSYSFLTAEDNTKWSIEKRLRRMLLTCNWKHAADPTANWVTIYLTMCYWVLRQRGLCEIDGLPFSGKDRHPLRLSIGHWHHGYMMTTGWMTANPTTFADFDINLCNIKAESWPANAFKNNYVEALIQRGLTHLTGVERPEGRAMLAPKSKAFVPTNSRWRKLVEAASHYGVVQATARDSAHVQVPVAEGSRDQGAANERQDLHLHQPLRDWYNSYDELAPSPPLEAPNSQSYLATAESMVVDEAPIPDLKKRKFAQREKRREEGRQARHDDVQGLIDLTAYTSEPEITEVKPKKRLRILSPSGSTSKGKGKARE